MQPTLISEIDFEGNPTATYHDTLFYDDSCQSYWRFNSAGEYLFGEQTVLSTVNNLNADKKNVCIFTCPEATTVRGLRLYLDGFGGGGASQVLKAVLYSVTAGNPDALLATSAEVTILANQAGAWVEFLFPAAVAVTATDYAIGLIAGATGATARFFADTTGGTRKNNSDTYSDGPANPFGTVTLSDGFLWSVYAIEPVLTDDTGNSDGTLLGGPTPVPGMLPFDTDDALQFDGTDDYAAVPATAQMQQSGNWTLEGLVKFDTLPGALKPLVTKGAFAVEIRSDNKLQFSVINHVAGTATKTTVVGTTPLEADTAYHVECIVDVTNSELRLVLNGLVEATASHSAGTELWGLPLLFAARHSGTSPAFGSAGAMFAIGGGNPSATWVVGAPASIAVGDLLIAHFFCSQNGSVATLNVPAGWTVLSSETVPGGANLQCAIAYKIAAAGDVGAGSYTFTWTGAQASLSLGGATISRYTGVDTSQPFANPPYFRSGNSTQPFTGACIPLSDDTLTLAMLGQQRSCSFTSPDGTEMYDTGGAGTAGTSIAGYYSAQGTATGKNFTATNNATAFTWGCHFLALKGPDAQDFCGVTLGQWSLLSRALDDDDAMDHSEARASGVGTWTDVTANSKGFESSRMRQYELDRFEAGTLAETLTDPDRDYDPSNTEGAHYPNVKTKRRHRIRATVGAETFPIIEVLVDRWPQKWLTPSYQEVTLAGSDGLATLAMAPVEGTVSSGLSGAQVHRILDMARWPRDRRRIDDGQFIMDAWVLASGAKALASLQTVADSELGQFFISADGYATFHDYSHRWTDTRSINVQALLSDDAADIAGGALPYLFGAVAPSFDDDTTVNEWTVATASGTSVTVRDVVGSRSAFGLADSRDTRLSSIADAEVQALALLQHTARAGQRFDKVVIAPSDETRWQTLLGLEISDLVELVRTPSVGSQIVQRCFVEGVEVEGPPTPDGEGEPWSVALALSPTSPASFEETALRSDPVSYFLRSE